MIMPMKIVFINSFPTGNRVFNLQHPRTHYYVVKYLNMYINMPVVLNTYVQDFLDILKRLFGNEQITIWANSSNS